MNLSTSLFGILTLAAASSAHAAFVMSISQVGDDVVLIGSGTLNTNGLNHVITGADAGILSLAEGLVLSGQYGVTYYGYTSPEMVGPSSLGIDAGGRALIDGFGDIFGAQTTPEGSAIFVASDYISGTFISGYTVYINTRLEDYGLIEGNYAWTWGTGDGADSFTLDVVAAVPEPAHYAIGAGVAALALVALRRRVK